MAPHSAPGMLVTQPLAHSWPWPTAVRLGLHRALCAAERSQTRRAGVNGRRGVHGSFLCCGLHLLAQARPLLLADLRNHELNVLHQSGGWRQRRKPGPWALGRMWSEHMSSFFRGCCR